jgi:chorismate mutase
LQPVSTDLQILALSEWFPLDGPLIIAGPCSAETEEQVLKTAEQISKIPEVKIFRSGIWKPRTLFSA